MSVRNAFQLSHEYVRTVGRSVNRFVLDVNAVGIRYAIQHQRALSRLHTFTAGERAELDYTKYLLWLYPDRNWEVPVLFQTGISIDHYAGVIKAYAITTQPTAATGIRLYKRSVSPKRLWLPPHLRKYADEWDVCGFDRLVALDNAMDLQSESMLLMFMAAGVILLCMPPKRGDKKGKVERTQGSLETRAISLLPGYVPQAYRFTDPRMKRIIERAKAAAKLTYAEYEELLLLAILDYNRADHPLYKRPRIEVYRNSLEAAPPVLPTGMRQIKSIFALTYPNVTVTREGVEVINRGVSFKYNLPELGEWRVSARDIVDVKVDPDDVRAALIYHSKLSEPLEVPLTTYPFTDATPIELALEAIGGESTQSAGDGNLEREPEDRVIAKLYEIQNAGRRGEKRRERFEAQAAAAAANAPPMAPPVPKSIDDVELAGLFGGEEPPKA